MHATAQERPGPNLSSSLLHINYWLEFFDVSNSMMHHACRVTVVASPKVPKSPKVLPLQVSLPDSPTWTKGPGRTWHGRPHLRQNWENLHSSRVTLLTQSIIIYAYSSRLKAPWNKPRLCCSRMSFPNIPPIFTSGISSADLVPVNLCVPSEQLLVTLYCGDSLARARHSIWISILQGRGVKIWLSRIEPAYWWL